jgi:hypothetical protein
MSGVPLSGLVIVSYALKEGWAAWRGEAWTVDECVDRRRPVRGHRAVRPHAVSLDEP